MLTRTRAIATLGALVVIAPCTIAAAGVGIQMSPADSHPGAFTVGQIDAPARSECPPAAKIETPPKGEYPPLALPRGNRWLEHRILMRLIKDDVGLNVYVIADGSHVRLTGDVVSEEARTRAAEIAGAFPGVTSVENQIDVIEDGAAASPDTRGAPDGHAARAAAAS
jgi:hypothetical protein